MTGVPAISVVMPLYNRAASVGAAIDSVLAQEFPDFELIVVDDGSSDGSPDRVAAYRDDRVRLIPLPSNQGGNAARNRGVEAARAPLVTFLDSDDQFLPEKLGWSVRYFEANPDVDVLLDSFVKRYPGRDRADLPLRNPVLTNNGEILEALFNRRIWKATPGVTARRSTIVAAGMFDEALRRRQDFDFIVRLAGAGRMKTTDQLLWIKNYSTDTISGGLSSFAKSTVDFYRRHPEYYSNPAYRPGFAHDLGRHFSRRVRKGQVSKAWSDARLLADELGWAKLLRLTASGFFKFRSRRRSIRAQAETGRTASFE